VIHDLDSISFGLSGTFIFRQRTIFETKSRNRENHSCQNSPNSISQGGVPPGVISPMTGALLGIFALYALLARAGDGGGGGGQPWVGGGGEEGRKELN